MTRHRIKTTTVGCFGPALLLLLLLLRWLLPLPPPACAPTHTDEQSWRPTTDQSSRSDSLFIGTSIRSSRWKSLEAVAVLYSVTTSSDSDSEFIGGW